MIESTASISFFPAMRRSLRIGTAFALPFIFFVEGCTGVTHWVTRGWVADYQRAERQAAEQDAPILIIYDNDKPGSSTDLRKLVDIESIRSSVDGYVRCSLVKSYEPDRRYVAQFGVQRAPALILVHRDGTYHARVGPCAAADIESFLLQATAPGQQPELNPHLPREAEYQWGSSLADAEQASKKSGQPILAVYHKWFSRDWNKLEKMLARPEVYRRVSEMIHCRIEVRGLFADTCITPFGALNLPAIVVARPDGHYEVLEMPTSFRAIVQLTDRALRTQPSDDAEPRAATAP